MPSLGHVQADETQVALSRQAVPHTPQLFGSVLTLVHPPSQTSVDPVGHEHAPPWQVRLPVHFVMLLQLVPQLFGSLPSE